MRMQHLAIRLWVLSVCLLAGVAGAQEPWPQPQNYVSDFAGVIPNQQEQVLNQLLGRLDELTSDEIAIAVVQSYRDRGYADIEETAVRLFEQWGIGQADQDNGLLVLVAIEEREWRIEVGYGLEGAVPDAQAYQLGNSLLPDAFRAGQYGEGLLRLSAGLIQEIAEERNISLDQFEGIASSTPTGSASRGGRGAPSMLEGCFSLLFFIFFVYMFIRHPRLMLLWLLMSSGGRNSHWGGGSQFGGGLGGGSFGGFGGGLSGGGGASGGW